MLGLSYIDLWYVRIRMVLDIEVIRNFNFKVMQF